MHLLVCNTLKVNRKGPKLFMLKAGIMAVLNVEVNSILPTPTPKWPKVQKAGKNYCFFCLLSLHIVTLSTQIVEARYYGYKTVVYRDGIPNWKDVLIWINNLHIYVINSHHLCWWLEVILPICILFKFRGKFYGRKEYYYNTLFLLLLKTQLLRSNDVYPGIWIGYYQINFEIHNFCKILVSYVNQQLLLPSVMMMGREAGSR